MDKTNSYLGLRILAGFIDYSIILVFFIIYVYTFGDPQTEGGYGVNGFKGLGIPIFWSIATVGLEQWFGATLGNSIVGLKPVSLRNNFGKISIGQSIKRHVLDIIDMSFFGIVGIITISSTKNNQRLGDLWANTTVIK